MSTLAKPILRGHIQRRGLKTIIGGVSFGIFCGGLYYFLVSYPRKQKYEEFVKTYDAQAHWKELAQKGYLQSYKVAKEKEAK